MKKTLLCCSLILVLVLGNGCCSYQKDKEKADKTVAVLSEVSDDFMDAAGEAIGRAMMEALLGIKPSPKEEQEKSVEDESISSPTEENPNHD